MKRINRSGFSLLEVLMVTAVGMIVTMTAIPNVVTTIGNMRLRSSMTSLAGVLQNCRMMAVKQNRTMSTHFITTTNGAQTGLMAYVTFATDTSTINSSDSQVQLEEPVVQSSAPSGVGAPTALATATLGFTPQTGDPSFNTTGLPCAFSGGLCPNYGFLYYFHDSRAQGPNGWAALSISPAGRLKKWYWSGSAWTD